MCSRVLRFTGRKNRPVRSYYSYYNYKQTIKITVLGVYHSELSKGLCCTVSPKATGSRGHNQESSVVVVAAAAASCNRFFPGHRDPSEAAPTLQSATRNKHNPVASQLIYHGLMTVRYRTERIQSTICIGPPNLMKSMVLYPPGPKISKFVVYPYGDMKLADAPSIRE